MTGPQTSNDLRWVGPLFLAITLLSIVPVWCVRHFPSTDGPAHLYNAWIIDEVLAGHHNAVTAVYDIAPQPWPNWTGHAVLAALLPLFAPATAEKILVTAIALLFLWGAWLFASANDPRNRCYAFLAIPFLFNWLFQLGFYNFTIAAALYLVAVGLFWRGRERPGAKGIVTIAAVLVLCYFSHPMPAALAVGSIGLLWLCSLPGRRVFRHALHLVALLPAVVLLGWYARQNESSTAVPGDPAAALKSLLRTDVLVTFDERQRIAGITVVAVVLLLLIATAVRDIVVPSIRSRRMRVRPIDGFVILMAIFATIAIFAPSQYAGGLFLRERTALLLYILPIVWLSPSLPRNLRAAIAVALTVVGIANAVFLLHWYRRSDRAITAYIATMDAIPANSTVLPLLFGRTPANIRLPCFSHALDYAAVAKHLVDYDNYEPVTGYFPTRVRPGAFVTGVVGLEAAPYLADIGQLAPHVDAFFTWNMPSDSALASALATRYALVSESGDARVYTRSRPRPADAELILLPLSGTVRRTSGAGGTQFEIEQTMTNVGRQALRVVLSSCAATPCDFTIEPGVTTALAAAAPYTLVFVPRARSRDLSFHTVVRRVDRPDLWRALDVPAVPEREFRSQRVVLPGVTWSGGTTVTVRGFRIGGSANSVSVSVVLPDRRVFARRDLPLSSDMFMLDLRATFPELPEKGVADLVIETRDSRLWAFATANDYAAGTNRLYVPR